MQTNFQLQYPIIEILNNDPTDYILSNTFYFKDIGNFTTYVATTNLARSMLVETESDNPEHKVYNVVVHDPLGYKFSEVLYFYNKFEKIIKSIDSSINVNFDKFQNHLLTGIVSGGTTFTCTLELILQDLIKYLNIRQYIQNEDLVLLVNKIEKFHRLVQDLYTDKSILFEPKISSKKSNILYSKFNKTIKEVMEKTNVFIEYCFFLEKHYISKNELYSDLFKKYNDFFIPLLVDIQKEYILHVVKSDKLEFQRMEIIDDTPVYFIEDAIAKLVNNHFINILALDYYNALEIVRWKNRLFGKGFKLFLNNEFAVDGKGNQPNPKYDLENFTKEFNKMIDDRMKLNQKFNN